MGKLILVLGGARSGKSSYAEELAENIGANDVTYIATAAVLDKEMEKRVDLHKNSRPKVWQTVEETTYVSRVISKEGNISKVMLLDCLTLLVSNLLLNDSFGLESEKEKAILEEVEKIALNSKQSKATVIVVSNEVGLGLVPTYELGREYRDIAGRANQLLASHADEVYFTIAGIPVEIKELSKKIREENNES